jgi:hypothetical protein
MMIMEGHMSLTENGLLQRVELSWIAAGKTVRNPRMQMESPMAEMKKPTHFRGIWEKLGRSDIQWFRRSEKGVIGEVGESDRRIKVVFEMLPFVMIVNLLLFFGV